MIKEIKGDIFTYPGQYYAHCISKDCALGMGIAVEFNKRFSLKPNLNKLVTEDSVCVLYNNIFNLITKDKYWYKPTYKSLRLSLLAMRDIMVENNIHELAMPRIGCGLDKLSWDKVKDIIDEIFKDFTIYVYYY